ncbi:MAG: HIT family protein [Oscillospiraceae bacterium]|nr:HIT family protein [Oscillospiraceae bacterium]
MRCIFCDIAEHRMNAHIVYEDELVTAFLDSDPINEGHVLIVPKEHFSDIDEMPDELLSHIMCMAKKIVKAIGKAYTPDGYSIMQNGGIFNDIGHFHLHIFPRYSDDGFNWTDNEKEAEYSKKVAEKIAVTLQTL